VPVNLGKEVFTGVCATCHGFRGEGLIGPAIATNPILADPKALRDLLRNGIGKMPAVGATWDDRMMNNALAYLKTFGAKHGG
jgi:mono/diheme cytochrome c family protein